MLICRLLYYVYALSHHIFIRSINESNNYFYPIYKSPNQISIDNTGINISVEEKTEISRINSPLPNHSRMNSVRVPESLSPASHSPGGGRMRRQKKEKPFKAPTVVANHVPPRFVVLDLSSVSNVDASAARGCFLQLAKMCAARKIVVCAAGVNSRIDWIMRTHETAHHLDEDGSVDGKTNLMEMNQKIILFDDLDEGKFDVDATFLNCRKRPCIL